MTTEWVLVPREPTANQLIDGGYEIPDPLSHRGEITARRVYSAMLDAAPVAPQQADAAYTERNHLVALLSKLYPAGKARTAIEGWSPEWHGCVYIDFPWGQASWHYHDRDAGLFSHLAPYLDSWDGHTTEAKYELIRQAVAAPQQAEPAVWVRPDQLKQASQGRFLCSLGAKQLADDMVPLYLHPPAEVQRMRDVGMDNLN